MRNLFFIALVIVLIAGCKKDSEEEIPHGTISMYNYCPLSIGNYWVYENYILDSLGNETLQTNIDSLYIDKDTTIYGKQYYVLEGSSLCIFGAGTKRFLRDSSGYIVNEKGFRHIAHNNFTDTLYNQNRFINGIHYYDISGIMKAVNNSISVASGTYDAIECEQKVIFREGLPNNGEIRYNHNYYANNIGQIVGSGSFSSSSDHFESRLLRYHIE